MGLPGRKYSATTGYRYGFNGQEKETDLNESITTAAFWEYDSRIGRRWNIDPLYNIWASPYGCFENNPIIYSDVLGLEGEPTYLVKKGDNLSQIAKANKTSVSVLLSLNKNIKDPDKIRAGDTINLPINNRSGASIVSRSASNSESGSPMQSNSTSNSTSKSEDRGSSLSFALNHPMIASTVGLPTCISCISGIADRFSAKSGITDDATNGDYVNGLRHFIWQSKITKEFGSLIAKEIGLSHESYPYINTSVTFETLGPSDADEYVDLKNNELARQFAINNSFSNNNDLAVKIVDYFSTNGFWVAQPLGNDRFRPVLTIISKNEANRLKSNIQTLNNLGFTPQEVKQMQKNEADAKKINRQLGITTGPKN
jgi:murein DD-endopeptidase MepM/ murein hydrolase activator NlpD